MFWICNMYIYYIPHNVLYIYIYSFRYTYKAICTSICVFLFSRAYGRKCYLACKLWCIHLYIYIYAFRPLPLLLHAELWEGRCKTICQNWQLFTVVWWGEQGGHPHFAHKILHAKIRSRYLSSRRTKQVWEYSDDVGWVIGTNHWMYWVNHHLVRTALTELLLGIPFGCCWEKLSTQTAEPFTV